MDIAKYIGLYILKNKYCCLQGLGNVEIKRTAASHNGQGIKSASYTVTLNPVGSIDDAFPNFVANNEHVSIAKASNEISEFIKASKAKMANGESVVIPAVGQYTTVNNRLQFELDSNFSLPTAQLHFPVAEAPKPIEDKKENKEEPVFEQYNNYNKQSSVNWNMVSVWGIIIIIGASIIGWGIKYFMNQSSPSDQIIEQVETIPTVPIDATPILIDSNLANNVDSLPAENTVVNNSDTPSFKFLIKEYNTLAKAEKRQKQLSSFGYTVSVENKDSSTFYVISTIKTMAIDTTRIKDSLSRNLNPAGVKIIP